MGGDLGVLLVGHNIMDLFLIGSDGRRDVKVPATVRFVFVRPR